MAQLEDDVRKSVADLIQGGVSTFKETGVTDVRRTYEQLQLLTASTLLFFPDSLYYFVKLATNRLMTMVNDELSILSEMLGMLDSIGVSPPVDTDVTALNNAYTALLSLDASSNVRGRPELSVFEKNMHILANNVGKPAMQPGSIEVSGEAASAELLELFASLSTTHTKVLDISGNIPRFRDDFDSVNIPTIVASHSFSQVRDRLSKMSAALTAGDQKFLAKNSRKMFIDTMASDSVVRSISGAVVPETVTYRGPVNPIPKSPILRGYAYGEGEPATASTGDGPWTLPFSADLTVSTDSGVTVVPLIDLHEAVLYLRHKEPFNFSEDKRLFVCLDPETYTLHTRAAVPPAGPIISTYVHSDSPINLGFAHLGATVSIPEAHSTNPDGDKDSVPRSITGFGVLANIDAGAFNPATQELSVTTWGAGGRSGFVATDKGKIISGYEVTEYLSPTSVRVNAPAISFPTSLTGIDSPDGVIEFSPEMTVRLYNGEDVIVGPAVKSALIPSATVTALEMATAINAGLGVSDPNNGAGIYVEAYINPYDSSQVCVRDRRAEFVQVHDRMVDTDPSVIAAPLITDSAHYEMGLYVGETDSGNSVSPEELASKCADFGISAKVVEQHVELSSSYNGPGSFISVTGPVELGIPSGLQHGTVNQFVARCGDSINEISQALPGDTVDLVGQGVRTITGNDAGVLTLATPISSDPSPMQFSIINAASSMYEELSDSLVGWSSRNSDSALSRLDSALAVAITSGGKVTAQVRAIIVGMIADIAELQSYLALYTPHKSEEAVVMLRNLTAQGYDRAVDVLLSADLSGFFSLTDESATYAGALSSAVVASVGDLPGVSTDYRAVQDEMSVEEESLTIFDDEYEDE